MPVNRPSGGRPGGGRPAGGRPGGGRPVVGWYVHHHGAGHVTRFLAVRPHLDAEVVVFSSMPQPRRLPPDTTWVPLDRDDDPVIDEDGVAHYPDRASPTARGALHWAPLGHPGHTRRLAAIARAVGERPFAAFVVDVSAEVAVFVRLLGVPPVVVTQPGDRSDAPHRLAYDMAERILAPWPEGVHASSALDRVRDRVRWVGGISRWDGRAAAEPTTTRPGTALVFGTADAARLAGAARAVPAIDWALLGATPDTRVDDPYSSLAEAEIVVSAAGQNSVADAAAVGSRLILVPQPRPFDEQLATARALAVSGLAVSVDTWPETSDWPALIRRARALDPDWSRWRVAGAAQRAAAVIAEVVEGRS